MPRRGYRQRPVQRTSEPVMLRALRAAAFRKQAGLCYWCKNPMKMNAAPDYPWLCTADHLIPKYAGGQTKPGNIVAACARCNNTRCAGETNRGDEQRRFQIGDDVARSPFDVLKG